MNNFIIDKNGDYILDWSVTCLGYKMSENGKKNNKIK